MPVSASTNYGTDLWCGFGLTTVPYPDGSSRTFEGVDLAADMRETSGRELLIQALVRRLITPRRTLVDDPDYGTDLTRWLNDDIDTALVGQIADEAKNELAKDERVKSASATATYVDGLLTLEIRVVDAAGPFRLVLGISDVTVTVLEAGK